MSKNNFVNVKTYLFLTILLLINSFISSYLYAEEIPADFDHDNTNFLLSGAHLKVACEVCHVREVYQGIPLSCEECHTTSSQIARTKKSSEHFESENACDNCHTVETWQGARIDHDSVVGTCIECHNNIVTTGRTSDHVQSVDECQECHTTRQWKQTGFDHNVISGNCFSCHNGSTAKGKPKKHRLSNNQCGECHQVKNWKSKQFDHKEIKTGCLNCHQDILPAVPHPQEDKCENCHSTDIKWQQVRFEHIETSEFCITCHKNRKPANHFIVGTDANKRCDECHQSTSSWLTNLRFDHGLADFQEHRTNTNCTVCHLSNSSNILWRYAANRPYCAGCHAASYNATSHIKSPVINYTVNELADCTSSCHSYSNVAQTIQDGSPNKNGNYHSALRGRGIRAP